MWVWRLADLSNQIWPKSSEPGVELPLVFKVVLVISQAHFLDKGSPKVQKTLGQLFCHGIEKLIRAVSQAKNSKTQRFQRIRRQVSPEQELPRLDHRARRLTFTRGGHDEDHKLLSRQLQNRKRVHIHDLWLITSFH